MEIVVYSVLEMAAFEVVVGWRYRERIHCVREAREGMKERVIEQERCTLDGKQYNASFVVDPHPAGNGKIKIKYATN